MRVSYSNRSKNVFGSHCTWCMQISWLKQIKKFLD